MIKLINIDLDGTLLKRHYIISKENMDAIEYAKKQGVLVGVNTGRNSTSAVYFSEQAGMNAPVVCCGGSLVLSGGDGVAKQPKDVMLDLMSRDVLKEDILPLNVIEMGRIASQEMDVSFYAQSKEGFYIIGEQNDNEFIKTWDKPAIDIMNIGTWHFKNFDEFMDVTKGRILKIGFTLTDKDKMNEMSRFWIKADCCQINYSLGCIMELTPYGSHKGSAVKFLQNMFGISKDETGCIGDDTNDVAMFEACGKSVAIGDGDASVTSIADYITDICEENGVAKGIYKLLEG